MSEQLRRQIFERHGPELGAVLFEAELARRARMADKVRRLSADLSAARSEHNRKSAELAKLLPPLEEAMQRAYDRWIEACNALEAQRVRNDANLATLQARIAGVTTELTTPEFNERVTQWAPADWHQPLPELPPMSRA